MLIAIAIATPMTFITIGVAAAIWLLYKLGEFVEPKRTERKVRRRSLSTAIYTMENLLTLPLTERGRTLMAENAFNRGTLPSWVEHSQLTTSEGIRAVIALLKRERRGWRSRKLHHQELHHDSSLLELVPTGA